MSCLYLECTMTRSRKSPNSWEHDMPWHLHIHMHIWKMLFYWVFYEYFHLFGKVTFSVPSLVTVTFSKHHKLWHVWYRGDTPDVPTSLISSGAELVHAVITQWLFIFSEVTHSAALIAADGKATHLLQISLLQRTRKNTLFFSGVVLWADLDSVPSLALRLLLLSVDFYLHPPPSPQPPSSILPPRNPAGWYHSLPLNPASCWGDQLLTPTPSTHHTHLHLFHRCHQMNHFTVGDELHGQAVRGTQATVCFGVRSCPRAQAGVNMQWVKRENESDIVKALFTIEIEPEWVYQWVVLQAARVWGAFN